MTEQGSAIADPLPPVPPEWVRLADLPGWIARCYGPSEASIAAELIHAVRRSELQHRIPGIKDNYSSLRSPNLPPGLENEPMAGTRRTFVTDWEAAEADWASGTVGGWTRDGARERFSIEVSWHSAERFAALRLRRWKRAATAASNPTLTGKPERAARRKPGRPLGSGKYPEDPALVKQAINLIRQGKAKSQFAAAQQVAGDPNSPSYSANVDRLRKKIAASYQASERSTHRGLAHLIQHFRPADAESAQGMSA